MCKENDVNEIIEEVVETKNDEEQQEVQPELKLNFFDKVLIALSRVWHFICHPIKSIKLLFGLGEVEVSKEE